MIQCVVQQGSLALGTVATTNCPDLSRARGSTDLPSCAATPSQGRTSPRGSSGNHRRGLEAYKGTSHVATTRITVVSPQFRAKPSYTREVGTLSGRAPSRCPGVTADPARVIVSRRRWPQSAGSNARLSGSSGTNGATIGHQLSGP
jgi:hypothetical protein